MVVDGGLLPVELETQFLYQNSTTGQASKTHLTTKQLCRILCPINPKTKHALLTPDTNVLRRLPNGSFEGSVWSLARSIPVLQEATTLWYHCTLHCNNAAGAVSPAVPCRQLPRGKDVRYSSALTTSEWKTLEELPNLQLALAAFEDDNPPPLRKQQQLSNMLDSATPAEATDTVQKELEAFLTLTEDREETDETYCGTGAGTTTQSETADTSAINLVQEQPETQRPATSSKSSSSTLSKRKHTKAKFSAKKGRCWIYVTGLPTDDCNESELGELFQKTAGLLDLDPETQRPKIKLYRNKDTGELKGDASICFARPESVSLAITLLDGTPFRSTTKTDNSNEPTAALTMSVQAAKFEQRGETFDSTRSRISNAKRKVAKLATMQAVDWDEGEFNGRLTGGRKGLRIIVLKHMFDPLAFASGSKDVSVVDQLLQTLEQDVRTKCDEWGVVEKITIFSQNSEGVVVVKFTQPGAASEAVKVLNGFRWDSLKRVSEASFWDGVTDFTVYDEKTEAKESEARQAEFGVWLHSHELPEEFRLRTE